MQFCSAELEFRKTEGGDKKCSRTGNWRFFRAGVARLALRQLPAEMRGGEPSEAR